jgi:hypothetical protein
MERGYDYVSMKRLEERMDSKTKMLLLVVMWLLSLPAMGLTAIVLFAGIVAAAEEIPEFTVIGLLSFFAVFALILTIRKV